MHITIQWFSDNFNVELASAEGKEAFLSIKGCRLIDGKTGPFVSYPARKNEQTGKWWSHVWGSDKFNAVVLSKAQATMPKQPARQQRAPSGGGGGVDDDIPFGDPLKGKLWAIG